jgi:hypothetical protein
LSKFIVLRKNSSNKTPYYLSKPGLCDIVVCDFEMQQDSDESIIQAARLQGRYIVQVLNISGENETSLPEWAPDV